MAWKPKEKTLTRDETIALARKNLAPYWRHTPYPLVASSGGEIHPLDEALRKKNLVFAVFDPLSFSATRAFAFLRHLILRYSEHAIYPIAVLRAPSSLPLAAKVLDAIATEYKNPFCFDYDGQIDQALSKNVPHTYYFPQAGIAADDPVSFESALQVYLRTTDIGLPLRPPPAASLHGVIDHSIVTLSQEGVHSTDAIAATLKIEGEWERAADYLRPLTPNSKIIFSYSPALSSRVAIVASSTKISRTMISLPDAPLPPEWSGANLVADENGRALLTVPSKAGDRAFFEILKTAEFAPNQRLSIELKPLDPVSIDLKYYRICFSSVESL